MRAARLSHFRLLSAILMLIYNRDHLTPGQARDVAHTALSYFPAGVTLAPDERRAACAALRRLDAIYNDRAARWTPYGSLGQWGGALVAIFGALGTVGAHLPIESVLLVSGLGLAAMVAGTWANERERDCNKPGSDLKELIKKVDTLSVEHSHAPDAWSSSFCRVLDVGFDSSHEELRATIVLLYSTTDQEAHEIMDRFDGIDDVRVKEVERPVESGPGVRIGKFRILREHRQALSDESLRKEIVAVPPVPLPATRIEPEDHEDDMLDGSNTDQRGGRSS